MPGFEQLFGTSARAAITSMDRAGDDVPTQRPSIATAIDDVGLCRRDVVIAVRDPFGSSGDARAVCTIRVSSPVPPTHRGVHVSRISDAVAKSVAADYADIAEYARALADRVAASQYGEATVTIWARIPYLETLGSVAGSGDKESLEHLRTMARARVAGRRVTLDVGLCVNHLVACPCVQRTCYHALSASVSGESVPAPGVLGPFLTHSQRCSTMIQLRNIAAMWSIADVLESLDGTLVRTCNTLPRDLELACVYRAHQHPQFIEDALRGSVAAVVRAVAAQTTFATVAARSRSVESIHDFDLRASLTLAAAECATLMR